MPEEYEEGRYEGNGEDLDNYGSSPQPPKGSSHADPDDYSDSKSQVFFIHLSRYIFIQVFSYCQTLFVCLCIYIYCVILTDSV